MEEDSIDIKKENEFIDSEIKKTKSGSLKYDMLLSMDLLLYQMADPENTTPIDFLSGIYLLSKSYYCNNTHKEFTSNYNDLISDTK